MDSSSLLPDPTYKMARLPPQKRQIERTELETRTNTEERVMGKKGKTEPPPSEFCEVCRLNHNQGNKHRYFPKHVKSLSAVLSRYKSKLSAVRSSLKNPSLLHRPGDASRFDRVWCVFCSLDVVRDAAASFSCENVIRHLASSEHLTKLKEFLRKHGGGMDRVDSFRISAADLLKWEKKCEALRSRVQSSSGDLDSPLRHVSKDIQFQTICSSKDVLNNNTVRYFEPTISCGVIPLRRLTNEELIPSYSGDMRIAHGSLVPYVGAPSSRGCIQQNLDVQGTGARTTTVKQQTATSGNGQVLAHYSDYGMDRNMVSGNKWRNGIRSNSYSEGPSPQSEMHAEDRIASMNSSTHAVSPSSQSRTLSNLNPKRVGAAWAEKRRRELEMEMRGEIVISYDPNWLPNFGGVWQSGTRKETRKDFEVEKQKGIKKTQKPETSVKIQPYISKRMRQYSNGGENSGRGD